MPDAEKVSYLVTFHTHLAALRSQEALKHAGVGGKLSPVPRRLSSSCGVCLRFAAQSPCRELLDADFEVVYGIAADGSFEKLFENA